MAHTDKYDGSKESRKRSKTKNVEEQRAEKGGGEMFLTRKEFHG